MKSRIRMIIMALLICVCVAIPAVSLNAADESDSNSNDACEVVKYEDLEEVKDYLAGKNTYPTKEGYLFAGWYTTDDILGKSDAEVLKYAVRNSVPKEGTVYALFVPTNVLDVKAQLSGGLLDGFEGNDKGSIRFVTTVNSLLYQKVGFEVSYINSNGAKKSATSSSNKVYDKLYAVGSTTDEYMENGKEYLPTEFSAASKYFKACNLKNIPESDFGVPITVKPFWVTLDGSKVYGETVIKSMDDYFLEEDVYVSNSDNVVDKADAEGYGTAEKPYETLNYALGKVKNQGTVHIVETYATDANFDWEEHNKTVNITGGELDFTTLPEVILKEAVEATDTTEAVPAVTEVALEIRDSVRFADITLNFADGQYVFANGNTLEIAESVVWGETEAYITLVGGSHNTGVFKRDTNLILNKGQYKDIYGAGYYYCQLNGDVNITLGGSVNSNINYFLHEGAIHRLFGGGYYSAKMTGDINITIASEDVKFNYIYGAGRGSGTDVTGNVRVNFAGKAMSVYGGGTGTVKGDTYVTMTGGWAEQVFGGCSHVSMTGNTNVDIQGGEVERRVYGGCYNELSWLGAWQETYSVAGHTNVAISPKASISYDCGGEDLSTYAISRGEAPFENEWGAFIFNETSYEYYESESKLGHTDDTYDSKFSKQAYHYLITTNGNTEDGSLGTVSPDGAYIRIKPRRGYSAVVVDKETNKEYYTESEGVFKLPELTSKTDTRKITVTFSATNSGIDKSGYKARIDGAYYESFEEAVAATAVLDSKETVTVTVLQDLEVANQMDITSKVTIQNEPGKDITIYRGRELATTDMFNVTSTGTLTLAGVEDRNSLVFDGRIKEEADANTSLDEVVGSTGSLIKADGNLNISNITIQYAKITGTADGDNGGAIYSTGANSKLSIVDSTFSYNKSSVRGGAIYAGDTRSKDITISGCIFEYNQAKNAGGAICIGDQNVLNIVSSEFIGNTSDNFGGAVAMRNGSSTVNLSGKVTFDGNIAKTTAYGGGAIMTGSVLNITENANVTIKNNETKGLGGGIYFNAANTPEFTLGESTILTMLDNRDGVDENSGTYRNVDIAIKNGGKAAEFKLNGAFDLDGIDTTIGTKITLGDDAQDSDSANITTVMLKAGNDSNATVQEGDRLVYGSKVADTIFDTKVGDVAYNLDANGYLVGLNPIVELRQENLTRQFASLDIALSEVTSGDTIAVLRDITLNEQLVIDKSVTITTDGEADRTIYCGAGAVSDNVIEIAGTDIQVQFMGTPNSQLIFDGKDVILSKAFVAVDSGTIQKATMQCVTMQNITSERSDGNGAAIYSEVPLEITKCEFKNCISNKHGGAIYCKADLTVLESVFDTCKVYDANTSDNYNGGAICSTGNYKLSITDSIFIGNTADYRGGAVYIETARSEAISISGCTFGNSADGGNAAANAGGAIHVAGANTINISESTFVGNASETYFGGAISVGTGTSTLNLSGTCVFTNNTAKGTSSYKGGGAIFAPVNFNIKEGAWVELYRNECTGYASGDVICINTDAVTKAKFVVEAGAALYIYNNPSKADADNDVCIKDGTALTPAVNGIYETWEPVAKIGNVGYETLQSAIAAVTDGGEILLIRDVTLNEKLSVSKSVTITTDGKANRTIYCGTAVAADNVVEIAGTDIEVTFKGTKDSKMIFDGTDVTLTKSFISAASGLAKKVTMQYVTMQNVTGENNGAAVNSEVPLEITNCKFEECTSNKHGGAVYCKANLTVQGSTFNACEVYDSAADKNYNGGAICSTGNHKLNIADSVFTENKADYRGGAVYIETARSEAISISGCTFGNSADGGNTANNAGGAIHVAGANTINISESTFVGNASETYFGGAISVGTGTSTLNLSGTCVFSNNTAAGASSYKGGGAIFAPVNFNIKEGAWIEMSGNECTDYASGDAICINTDDTSKSKFIVEAGASLYIYDNPSTEDADNDIGIKDGTTLTPTVNEGANYSTSAPTTE